MARQTQDTAYINLEPQVRVQNGHGSRERLDHDPNHDRHSAPGDNPQGRRNPAHNYRVEDDKPRPKTTGDIIYDIPSHVYDRYDAKALAERQKTLVRRSRTKPSGSQDVGEFTTLYIPKVNAEDGTNTLYRKRKSLKRRRTSSKRKRGEILGDELTELLADDEDNHMLPSMRLQRRIRMKSLKDRKLELEQEEREDDALDGPGFSTQLTDLKDHDNLTAANFASLLRTSTMRKIEGWKRPKKVDRFKRRSREFLQHFQLWLSSFKEIEGKFGTAVMGYFRFVRWLMLLNVYMMIIMFGVVTVPFLVLKPYAYSETVDVTVSEYHSQSVNCTTEYADYTYRVLQTTSTFHKVLDFLSGTGWMERTVLFYGQYHNKTYYLWESDGLKTLEYNMPLAYLLAMGVCFIICFLLIVKNSAKTVKSTYGRESELVAFNNRVFSGWDYAISKREAAGVKKTNLYIEFIDSLLQEKLKISRSEWTSRKLCNIYLVRVLVNIFVLALLVGSLYLVYYTTDKLLELQKEPLNDLVLLIVQYLPYFTITILNFAIPLLFQKLVQYEEYSHGVALRLTLARSIILRLASLAVLMFSLYRLLILDTGIENSAQCGNQRWSVTSNSSIGSVRCWETYVGQQIYKLVLLDLIVESVIMVFLMFPRSFLFKKYGKSSRLIRYMGPQEFDLSQSVIDIIYSQTLCWLGMFFSPLIPFMTFAKCIIFFYLRKWTLMNNCEPSKERYRTSRSNSLFMTVTLFSFILSAVPTGYMISSIPPSQSCGPFRIYSSPDYVMFSTISNTITSWPLVIREIFLFLGTVGFFIPLIIILLLLMYFYWLLGQGYKKREKILSHQLKLEGKDKHFLLDRVNEVLGAVAADYTA